METSMGGAVFSIVDVRSYRTYEEWKPTKGKNLFGACNGSYRTYEEWKLNGGENIA